MSAAAPGRPRQRIAVGVEYDGGAFVGWQAQQGLRSVQGELEAALARVADHPVELVAAGRTDAGVHGRGQVAHFDTDASRSMRAWVLGANSALPADVSLSWATAAPPGFHARFSALARTYRYLIFNRAVRSALVAGRAAWVCRPLALEPMRAAARSLVGEHDFSAFRAAGCQARSPVRTLERLEISRHGDWVVLEATSNAFLHHMVRNIAGLLIEIGKGRRPVKDALRILAGRDRRASAATAPAAGLYFWSVRYPPEMALPPADSALGVPSAIISG